MNIYKISQDDNADWDTFDSAVVLAPSANVARNINPSNGEMMTQKDWEYAYSSWCSSPEKVKVEYLGRAPRKSKQGVVVASFNAG